MEVWEDGESRTAWERAPGTSLFSPVSRGGRPLAGIWSRAEVCAALGCPKAPELAAGGAGSEFFPPSFRYAPAGGEALRPAAVAAPETWLPPCGSERNAVGLLRGGRLTQRPLRLEDHAAWPADPDVRIPFPPPGRRSFLVAACGLRSSFLFSLDARNGCIFCWAPAAREWAELRPADSEAAPYLGAGARLLKSWRPEAADLAGGTRLLWPCDAGIVAIRLDPLTLTYFPEVLTAGRCVAPLLPNGGGVFGLFAAEGGAGLTLVGGPAAAGAMTPRLSGIPDADWGAAVATPHDAVWLSRAGQVVLNLRKGLRAFFPWPKRAGTPVFEFGPPYCWEKGDGGLWQQMQTGDGTEEGAGYAYASLGAAECGLHAATGARQHTGRSSIKVEQRLTAPPWQDPELVHFEAYENDEAVVPLLESAAEGGDLLVLRADHAAGAAAFFEREEAIPTRFQILRQQPDDKGFHAARLHRPWETQAFVYGGRLFLYHPEMPELPGWTLRGAGK